MKILEEILFHKGEDLFGGDLGIFPIEGADLVDEFGGSGGAEIGFIEESARDAQKSHSSGAREKEGADFLREGREKFFEKSKHYYCIESLFYQISIFSRKGTVYEPPRIPGKKNFKKIWDPHP